MKVGLLTFHRATNYGTALQAYASVTALRDVGVDAEIVDYRPEYIERTARVMSLRDVHSFKNLLGYGAEMVFRRRTKKNRIKEFGEFIEELPMSETFYDKNLLGERCAGYDLILSGSDQIWNPIISEGDMSYFLPFGHPRKASFATSFGAVRFSDEVTEEIAGYLRDFDFISVREETAARYIRNMAQTLDGIPSPVAMLDPTLLYGIDWWRTHSLPADLPKNGYILVYCLRPTPLILHAIERVKRETGLPVLNIKPTKRDILMRNGVNVGASGPARFLSYLSGASYVVTNSFHGTAFSLNFEKPFVTVTYPVKNDLDINSRMTDLLALTGMSHRRATTEDEIDRIPLEVDFTDVRARLADARKASWDILREIVGK